MRRRTIGIVAVALLASAGTAGAVGRDLGAPPLPPPIPSSQNPLLGPAYVGSPTSAQPVPSKVRFRPSLSLMHADAGNTNTSNFPGPLGVNPVLQSAADLTLVPFMWDAADRLTTGCVAPGAQSSGRPLLCLAAVDPQTLEILARWLAPNGQDLNLAYLAETTDDQVLVTTREGHVFVVQRHDDRTGPSFSLVRDVDLVGRGVLKPSELLLAAMFDWRGNIWFTTGGILGIGDKPGPFTTLGYIDSNEGVHSIRIDDQIVENGFAVSGGTAFVVTGPAGADDHPGAIGQTAAFDAGPSGTVQTLWRVPYQAGDARKPGGFARGSGSTPTLLGHRYVAITDNANSQIHLLIYRQGNLDDGRLRLVCSVPLFSPGASANDIGTIGEETHNADSVMALNDYNAPPIGTSLSPATINGSFNNTNQMAPGAERVDVAPGGTGCRVAW
ncbi:MAG TPA: hypothetical protein VLL25_18975, partial [Acidimicrobiales bacterium]|nr:hypothetical protein [Acidimicrobiales bacterium]